MEEDNPLVSTSLSLVPPMICVPPTLATPTLDYVNLNLEIVTMTTSAQKIFATFPMELVMSLQSPAMIRTPVPWMPAPTPRAVPPLQSFVMIETPVLWTLVIPGPDSVSSFPPFMILFPILAHIKFAILVLEWSTLRSFVEEQTENNVSAIWREDVSVMGPISS